jgi:hypothetical protein
MLILLLIVIIDSVCVCLLRGMLRFAREAFSCLLVEVKQFTQEHGWLELYASWSSLWGFMKQWESSSFELEANVLFFFSPPVFCLITLTTGENWSVEVSLHFTVVAVVDLEHLLKEILFPWSSLLYLRWSGHCVIEIRQFPAQRQSGHTKKLIKRRLQLYLVWWRFKESLPERQSQHTASF